MQTLELRKDDFELLNQVLAVPLHAFGLEQLTKQTNLEEKQVMEFVEKIAMTSLETNQELIHINLEMHELEQLIKLFSISCEIIGHDDLHTLTGYEWSESEALLKKMWLATT